MTRLARFVLLLSFAFALIGCPSSPGPAPGPVSSSEPAPSHKLKSISDVEDVKSSVLITWGGTATGTAAPLAAKWVVDTSYVVGQVAQANGRICAATTAGISANTGSGPATTGTGITDGPGGDGGGSAVVWSCYSATGFRGILVTDTDASNALYVGPYNPGLGVDAGASLTAGGVASGSYLAAGGGMTWPAGTNATYLDGITAGSSVAFTVALTF